MADDSFFGGLAEGFSSGAELGLKQQKLERDLAKDKATEARAAQGQRALESYRASTLKLQERRAQLQERQLDVQAAGQMRTILSDPNMYPAAKNFMLDQMAKGLGQDPKSDTFKELKKLVVAMPIEQANALSEALVSSLPNMEPGKVREVLTGLIQGKVNPAEIPKILQGMNQQAGRQQILGGQGQPPPGGAGIDPNKPQLANPNGSFSTERTIGIEVDGKHVNIPTIVNGQQVSRDEAVRLFMSGQNPATGTFNSREEADAAAQSRSDQIGATVPNRTQGGSPVTETQDVDGMGPEDFRRKALQMLAGGDKEGAAALAAMAKDLEPSKVPPSFEAEEPKRIAAIDSDELKDLRKESDKSREVAPSLDAFETALDGGRFTTGSLGGVRESVSQMMQFLGIDSEHKTLKKIFGSGDPASAETMQAASNQLALSMSDKMSRMTNMSLEFVRNSVPNLTRTPDGNRLIIEMIRAANKRSQDVDALSEEYLANYGTLRPKGKPSWRQAVNTLREKPLFDEGFKKRVQEAARQGQGVDIQGGVEDLAGDLKGKNLTLGDKTFPITGKDDKGRTIVKTPRHGNLPVIMSTEDYDAWPIDPKTGVSKPFVWGGNGREVHKVKKKAK